MGAPGGHHGWGKKTSDIFLSMIMTLSTTQLDWTKSVTAEHLAVCNQTNTEIFSSFLCRSDRIVFVTYALKLKLNLGLLSGLCARKIQRQGIRRISTLQLYAQFIHQSTQLVLEWLISNLVQFSTVYHLCNFSVVLWCKSSSYFGVQCRLMHATYILSVLRCVDDVMVDYHMNSISSLILRRY